MRHEVVQPDKVHLLVDRVSVHFEDEFANETPHVIGSALADLLARWIAGHFVVGDEPATQELRDGLLEQHIREVGERVSILHRELIKPQL